MKQIAITLTFLLITLFSANVCQAAFPVKSGSLQTPALSESSTATSNVVTTNHSVTRHSLRHMLKKSDSDAIPQILYIILAIIGLGWVGMGINDGFEDYDWLISLILYLLFYIPGLIYTLIMMSKYY